MLHVMQPVARMAENHQVRDQLRAEALIGAMVHLKADGMRHVQRTRVVGAQKRGRPSPPPLRRPQIEPIRHRTKLSKPLDSDRLIHSGFHRQEHSVSQAPGTPLRVLNQTVALQVGQRPRQVVIDQARVFPTGTFRWRSGQLARAKPAVGQRSLKNRFTPSLTSKRPQGVEHRRPSLLTKRPPLRIVQRCGHVVYWVIRFRILSPALSWPTVATRSIEFSLTGRGTPGVKLADAKAAQLARGCCKADRRLRRRTRAHRAYQGVRGQMREQLRLHRRDERLVRTLPASHARLGAHSGDHSFEQRGAYPLRPFPGFSQRRGNTSARPRKRLANSATLRSGDQVAPASVARSASASRAAARSRAVCISTRRPRASSLNRSSSTSLVSSAAMASSNSVSVSIT
jgi:hypothetical protein